MKTTMIIAALAALAFVSGVLVSCAPSQGQPSYPMVSPTIGIGK